MTNLKSLQNELNTVEKALQHLAEYTSVFEHNEHNKDDWMDLQETMRELYVMQRNLRNDKKSINL